MDQYEGTIEIVSGKEYGPSMFGILFKKKKLFPRKEDLIRGVKKEPK